MTIWQLANRKYKWLPIPNAIVSHDVSGLPYWTYAVGQAVKLRLRGKFFAKITESSHDDRDAILVISSMAVLSRTK